MRFANRLYNVFILLITILGCMLIINCKKVDRAYEKVNFSANDYGGTILDYLKSRPAGIFDSLLYVVDKVDGFSDLLKKDSITLFALINKSFSIFIDNLNNDRKVSENPKQPLSLSTIDVKILDTALSKYLIAGALLTNDLNNYKSGNNFKTIKHSLGMHLRSFYSNASGVLAGGPTSIILSDTHESDLINKWEQSQTDFVNIKTTNGVIHIIGAGEVFGFGNYLTRTINTRQ